MLYKGEGKKKEENGSGVEFITETSLLMKAQRQLCNQMVESHPTPLGDQKQGEEFINVPHRPVEVPVIKMPILPNTDWHIVPSKRKGSGAKEDGNMMHSLAPKEMHPHSSLTVPHSLSPSLHIIPHPHPHFKRTGCDRWTHRGTKTDLWTTQLACRWAWAWAWCLGLETLAYRRTVLVTFPSLRRH